MTDKSENSDPGKLMFKKSSKGYARTFSTALNLDRINKTGSQIEYEESVHSFEEILYTKKDLRACISAFKMVFSASPT